MIGFLRTVPTAFALLAPMSVATAPAELPAAIAAKAAMVVLQLHAEGAQIYECKSDSGGQLIWQFREPIASLFLDGKTVGRHYAGPTWESAGSAVVGKTIARAPGATSKDIPWLRLDVSERRGDGPLKDVTTVQRINTNGGNVDGKCETAGDFRAEPYSADYVFLRQSS